MTPLVEIRDLLVKRGEHPALQLGHLAIQHGEVLAVVGPNGAGKSTLLLTLARLLRPERGEIQFNGQPASAESDTVYRRRLALVLGRQEVDDQTTVAVARDERECGGAEEDGRDGHDEPR